MASDVVWLGVIEVAARNDGVVAQQFNQGRAQKIELRLDPVEVALHRDDVVVLMPGHCGHCFLLQARGWVVSVHLNMEVILANARDPNHTI